jgi:hypothetical protein
VASEVTYDDLDIADGGEASAAFYRIVADPTLAPEGRDELRESLLKYCARDTLALAYVHRWLMKGDGPSGPDHGFSGQLKKRAGRKWASSDRCRPCTISSATSAPRNGDIVTPLWVMAI